MVEMTQRMTLSEERGQERLGIDGESVAAVDGSPQSDGWVITISEGDKAETDSETIESCAVGLEGTTVVGVGSRGSTWIWVEEPMGGS